MLIVNSIGVGSRFIDIKNMKGEFFMFNDERFLTIQEALTPSYRKEKFSRILLQGKWLTELGFAVGKKVSVETYMLDGKPELVVRPVD